MHRNQCLIHDVNDTPWKHICENTSRCELIKLANRIEFFKRLDAIRGAELGCTGWTQGSPESHRAWTRQMSPPNKGNLGGAVLTILELYSRVVGLGPGDPENHFDTKPFEIKDLVKHPSPWPGGDFVFALCGHELIRALRCVQP